MIFVNIFVLTGLSGVTAFRTAANGTKVNLVSHTETEAEVNYIGCYSDASSRKLPVMAMASGATIESCSRYCDDYKYFGLQNGDQCFCGNGPHLGHRKPEAECNRRCGASLGQTCGGEWRNSIYVQVGCNWQCYLEGNPDVQKAFGNNAARAERHYQRHGKAEGRDCTCQSIFHLAPQGVTSCDVGSTPAEAACEAAADLQVEALGRAQGRHHLVIGSWRHLPYGCSVQSLGDWAVHFNRNRGGRNDGTYSLVCSGVGQADYETMLFKAISESNFAFAIKSNNEVDKAKDFWVNTANSVAALDGVASMVVGMLTHALDPDEGDFGLISDIMGQVGKLIADRERVRDIRKVKNAMENIQNQVKKTKNNPAHWLYIADMVTNSLNDAYGGGPGSCWSTTFGYCPAWRKDGFAFVVSLRFTELLITIASEIHDYIVPLGKGRSRDDAIGKLKHLAEELNNGTGLLETHWQLFEARRSNWSSSDHGLMGSVGCNTPHWSPEYCDINGPYDFLLQKRICQSGVPQDQIVNTAHLNHLKYECHERRVGPGNRRRRDVKRGGCSEENGGEGGRHGYRCLYWSEAACYLPRINKCVMPYKMAVLRDLNSMGKKMEAVQAASAAIVKDARKQNR